MASINVCIWNVQDYGCTDGEAASFKWGDGESLRNQFIARFIETEKIDVLMMMEATSPAQGPLQDLVRRLNHTAPHDWVYCHCGSGLAAALPDPPTNKDKLTFKADGRREGYAVLWRTGNPNFQVLQGLHEISTSGHWDNRNPNPPAGNAPLNLVTKGREAGNRTINGQLEYGPLGGYLQGNTKPYDGNRALVDWASVKFPTVGLVNPQRLKIEDTRRPAYVVLKLNPAVQRGPRYRLCPIAVYHAPSRMSQAKWGALQAGLSRELYVTNEEVNLVPDPAQLVCCENTVFGGDFNYHIDPWPGRWPGEFQYITNFFGAGPTGGAQCHAAPLEDAQQDNYTTVQLRRGELNGTEIDSTDPNAYLTLAIDRVFYRGSRYHRGRRVNLLKTLEEDNDDDYGDVLREVVSSLRRLEWWYPLAPPDRGPMQTRDNQWVPLITGGWGSTFLHYSELKNQLDRGRLTGARQLAEFVRMFVSDHLPLVVQLDCG